MADLIDPGTDRGLDVLAMKCVRESLPGRPTADDRAILSKLK